MKKILFVLIVLLSTGCVQSLLAQENENKGLWSWGFYSGVTPHLDTDLKSLEFIRKESGTSDDYYFDYVEGTFYSWNLGVKVERSILDNHLSLFSGLQYVNVQSGMDASDYGSSDYMLVNVNEGVQGVEYLRAKRFNQSAGYIGIPVGVKYIPLSDHFVNLYINTQVDFNILIHQKVETEFVNSSMNKYSENVEGLFGDPTSLYSTFTFKGGLKLGRAGHPHVCLELGPTIVLSDDPSCITTSDVGFTFTVHLMLPF